MSEFTAGRLDVEVWGLALTLGLASGSCVTLDGTFFQPEAVERYGWDDDPCDPQLLGDIAVAQARETGETPTCHPSLVPADARREGFVEVEGRDLHWVLAVAGQGAPTIVYSHGRAKHLGAHWDRVEYLWQLGFNVLTYDYPGFGRSDPGPLTESALVESGRDVLAFAAQQPEVDPDRLIAMGYSLGGTPTAAMALDSATGDGPKLSAVVLEAAFCSNDLLVDDAAQVHLDADWFFDDDFDNCARFAEAADHSAAPLFIIAGTDDQLVRPGHAPELADAAGGASVTWIEGGDHDDLPVVGAGDYRAVFEALR